MHVYDWAARMSKEATHCYHLAVAGLGEQKGLDGKIVALLATCLKCNDTIVVTEQYIKTDRQLGENSVYIKRLHKIESNGGEVK